ncbi:MAG: ATP-binding protein [Neomegalonema sp.]|nr:ATP-binding protein [Neomegalonema sp.]
MASALKDLDHGALPGAGEDAWLDVIQKMDEVYSNLVDSQTQLETQNALLEEAQAFIRSVMSAMTDVLIVCDFDCHIQQVNKALEQQTGRQEMDLIGLPLEDLVATEFQPLIAEAKTQIAASDRVADLEIALIGADGHPAPLAVNCAARRDHNGKLVGAVFVGRPIGELRRAYRKLDEAHTKLTQTQQRLVVSEKMAALGRLVAGVAHELNNPISFIFGNMHALKRYEASIGRYLQAFEQSAQTPELQELRAQLKIDRVMRDIGPLVEGTLEGAERVNDIVQDLRRFSSNQEEPEETFNLVRLAHTAVDWVVRAERLKPEVRFDTPERLDIVGRRGHLHQILVNLAQNAADVLAGRENPILTVRIRRDGNDVLTEVQDNGPGVRPDEVDKIFEPFFTTKPIGQGTGLGLYVSYGMAAKSGGDLTVANAPDGGAIFTLRLPAQGKNDHEDKN